MGELLRFRTPVWLITLRCIPGPSSYLSVSPPSHYITCRAHHLSRTPISPSPHLPITSRVSSVISTPVPPPQSAHHHVGPSSLTCPSPHLYHYLIKPITILHLTPNTVQQSIYLSIPHTIPNLTKPFTTLPQPRNHITINLFLHPSYYA